MSGSLWCEAFAAQDLGLKSNELGLRVWEPMTMLGLDVHEHFNVPFCDVQTVLCVENVCCAQIVSLMISGKTPNTHP